MRNDFNIIPPFKGWVLENFPFIEADFDAITNYQLLCKIIEYLNKVIDSENKQNIAIEDLYNKFIELKNYIDNLDLQEYVDNKIDEMVESGELQEIIVEYLEPLLAYKVFYANTVADMKDTVYSAGDLVITKGYYAVNDGGSGKYVIVDDNTLVDDGGLIHELDNGLFAKLIVENNTINVKQYGVKSDNVTDNTTQLNKCLANTNNYTIFFPNGLYRTSYLAYINIDKNIKIYGDNATIKLLDHVITANSQRIFSIYPANNSNCIIEIYGLNIDMNFTNNKDVIISSGDEWALQHCHAILIYGNSGGDVEVIAHDLTFNDLIADGFSLGGNYVNIVNRFIANNIISKNRTAKRSDICVTCDFDSINCSNMILDKFEIEVNSARSNTRRTVLIDNIDLTDTLDLDIGNNDGQNILYCNNVRVNNYFHNNIENAIYTNCTFNLGHYIRLIGVKVKFANCNFYTNSEDNFDIYDASSLTYIKVTDNSQLNLSFDNCEIKYNNAILTTGDDKTYFIDGILFTRLELNNCNINISSQLIRYRGGDLVLNDNIYNTSNTNIVALIEFKSWVVGGVDSNAYLYNNITNSDVYLLLPPTSAQNGVLFTIYENNPSWALGKVLHFTRFDRLVPFNGGSGEVIKVNDLTEYYNNDVPNDGIWLVGQRIRKSSSVGTSIGWICTVSGSFESGNAPTFRELEV